MTQRSSRAVPSLALGLMLLLALSAVAGPGRSEDARGAMKAPPNIVVIMTDDQDQASMWAMPKTRRLIGRKGVTFANNFTSNPVCCPSRSTFLSGRYAHNTGVYRNNPPHGGVSAFDDSNALPVWLQDSGYTTALIGKYLNGYGGNGETTIPPGWSEWYGSTDPGTYRMYGYTLNENGSLATYGNYDTPDPALYQTDVYAEKAVDFIDRQAPAAAPFFLEVTPLAPHTEVYTRPDDGSDDPPTPNFPNPRPAPRDADAFASEPLVRGPSFDEADVSDKPAAIQARPLMSNGTIGMTRKRYRSRLASLLAVDDMVSRVVAALRQSGELDNTVILFTSDNGFEQGEHRIPNGKEQPYEESLRVPLLIRGPDVPRGQVRKQTAANVDLAPTIAGFAGAELGHPVDGESLIPVIDDRNLHDGRAIAIENWCQTNESCYDPGTPETPRFQGVRTDRFKFVRYPNGDLELYDLARDPYELKSLPNNRRYGAQRRALGKLLDQVQSCAGRDCRVAPDLTLKLSYERGRTGGGGNCADSAVVATPGGYDGVRAITVTLLLPGGKRITDDQRPLRIRVPASTLPTSRTTPLTAEITAVDGRIASATAVGPHAC